MDRFTYPVTLKSDESDGGFVVTFRDIPEAITQGDSTAECLDEAAGALEAAVMGRIQSGMSIPVSSEPLPGEMEVPVPLQTAMKAALYLAMKEADVSEVELARQLPAYEKEMLSILDPQDNTELPVMERALSVLGKRVELHLL